MKFLQLEYGVFIELPFVQKVTCNATLVILSELEQHKSRLGSSVNIEKKR